MKKLIIIFSLIFSLVSFARAQEVTGVDDISTLLATAQEGKSYKFNQSVIIILRTGDYLWVADETGGFLLYNKECGWSNLPYSHGELLPAGAAFVFEPYNGGPAGNAARWYSTYDEPMSRRTPEPTVLTAPFEFTSQNANDYVKLSSVTVIGNQISGTSINVDINTTFDSAVIANRADLISTGVDLDIYGVVFYNNINGGSYTIMVTDILTASGQPMEKSSVPTILGDEEFESETPVTITALPDARIYYTVNGLNPVPGDPTTTEYTEPFEVHRNCTVKAIAVESGKLPSDVVSKDFKKVQPRPEFWNASCIEELLFINDPGKYRVMSDAAIVMVSGPDMWVKDNGFYFLLSGLEDSWTSKDFNKGDLLAQGYAFEYSSAFGNPVGYAADYLQYYTKKSGSVEIIPKQMNTQDMGVKNANEYVSLPNITVADSRIAGTDIAIDIQRFADIHGSANWAQMLDSGEQLNIEGLVKVFVNGTDSEITLMVTKIDYSQDTSAPMIEKTPYRLFGRILQLDADYSVYDLNGHRLDAGMMSPGFYIIAGGSDIYKIVIK